MDALLTWDAIVYAVSLLMQDEKVGLATGICQLMLPAFFGFNKTIEA